MTQDLAALAWPAGQLGHAIEVLARKSGLDPKSAQVPIAPAAAGSDSRELQEWIDAVAQWFGLEAEPVDASYETIDQMLRVAGPALVRVQVNGEAKFFALLGGSRKIVSLLCPNLKVTTVRREIIRSALLEPVEAPLQRQVVSLIEDAEISARRQARAREAVLRECLRGRPIASCWILRLPPGASFWRQLRQAGIPHRMLLLIGAYSVEYFLWLLSWSLIGLGALAGRFDRGWLLAWSLLLLTVAPFRLLGSWLQGALSIGAATLLKRRLLYGALRLAPEEIRRWGAGQFLGQVLESEVLESMALSGGFVALISATELTAATCILGWGAGAAFLRLLLVGWILLTASLAYGCYRRRQVWSAERLKMTHDLIESMTGYRTRIAQEPQKHWHDSEDKALERYLEISRRVDRTGLWLTTLAPNGWLIVSLIGFAPAFASGRNSAVNLAIPLGGILLAYHAMGLLSTGLWNLIDAVISWKQVAPLFHAAARPQAAGLPIFRPAETPQTAENRHQVIEAHDLVFRYQERGEPALQKCSICLREGDRVLLQGPSGGGKSTLASLLAGLRTPQSGLLLLEGMDWRTLGMDGWRRRIVAAPQFHENHVVTETFAFNLLMGRRWPPFQSDISEAEEICRELGLDKLIERMPAGLFQLVGETGWQLSHGERSLLYIARALLQRARIIILDESFAALDPETLRRALQCVLQRASTLMVVAHP
jgi:ATP-binding cassette, subfamily B, bacterial